jgi:hypothetical protein
MLDCEKILTYHWHIIRGQVTRTVVAKEIAKIVYYVLKNKTQYKGLKGQPISRQKSQQWPRLSSPLS